MAAVWDKLSRFTRDESGATAIEYGLIAAMIAVSAIAAMTAFGNILSGMFNFVDQHAGTAMDNAGIWRSLVPAEHVPEIDLCAAGPQRFLLAGIGRPAAHPDDLEARLHPPLPGGKKPPTE